MDDVHVNRGTGIASLNRYFPWGSELRPWPGELEYLNGVTLQPAAKAVWQNREPRHARQPTRASEYDP
jgi:hypothetical protein